MDEPSGAGATQLHQALASVARAIADSLEIRTVWDRVAEACRTVVPFDAMGIATLGPDGTFHPIAAAGELALKPFIGQVLSRADISPRFWPHADEFQLIIRDVPSELDPAYALDRIAIHGGYRSALRVSLTGRGRRLGSILLIAREPGRFDEQHAQALTAIAELVAVALAHQQLAADLAEETRRTAVLEQRVQVLSQELDTLGRHRALGSSRPWRDVLKQATQVAATETTVLLSGQSGTGKEVIARLIHRGSPRKDGLFVALNCAALAEQLLESELFGHEKGAFTGAQAARPGRIEQAAGGVLFLDEVGEMSPGVQAKVLRVLQECEYQRLGGLRTLTADVRVLAATNRDLRTSIARGTFREDLYYRLAVFDITLPPLRERPEDILELADAFLEDVGRSVGRPAAGIAEDARARLAAYGWPGNVRELRNVIERAVILSEGGLITSEHLPMGVARAASTTQTAATTSSPAPGSPATGERPGIEHERRRRRTRGCLADWQRRRSARSSSRRSSAPVRTSLRRRACSASRARSCARGWRSTGSDAGGILRSDHTHLWLQRHPLAARRSEQPSCRRPRVWLRTRQ